MLESPESLTPSPHRRRLSIMRPEDLTEHAGFLRRLAVRLLADASAADDVVAEAWRVALEKPPSQKVSLRAWLGGVVRSLSRQRNRSESRRRNREEAAPPSTTPTLPPDELLEREESVRALVDAVFGLREPFRSVVLLRFYDDFTLKQIAARLDCPVDTARTRLKRAMAELRDRMDARHDGDRRSWCLGLVAAFRSEAQVAGVAGTIGGVLVMSTTLKLAAVGVIGVLCAVPFLERGESRPESHRAEPPKMVVDAAAAPAVVTPGPTGADRKQAAADDDALAPATGVSWTSEPFLVGGRCVDERGAPVAGAHVVVRLDGVAPEQRLGETTPDDDGRFAIDGGQAIRALPWYQRRAISVLAIATKEDYRLARKSVANDVGSGPRSEEFTLTLRRRPPRLFLSVLDGRGGAVGNVQVALVPESSVSEAGESVPYSSAWKDDEGRIVADLPESAGLYRIRVMVEDRGTGEVGPIPLRPDRSRRHREAVTLVLEPGVTTPVTIDL